nr:phosphoadenylyl-sulfate reductase [Bacillus sp. FJAT-45350]
MAELSYQSMDEEGYQNVNRELDRKDALDVLKWTYSTFEEDVVYACSFGAEGMVMIDLISKVKKDATIAFLDTDVHFKETYELIEKVRQKYPQLNIKLLKSEITLEEQTEQYGAELWKTNPDQCCQVRKLQPLEKELSNYSAWISGLRREQSPTRQSTQFVNKDNRFQSIKICPLIHWTWEEVWMYIRLHQLPYNELHDKNYPSIGCEHCTLPVDEDGDSRSGRWAGKNKTECGLHQ